MFIFSILDFKFDCESSGSVLQFYEHIRGILKESLGRKGDYIDWKQETLEQDEEMTVTLEDLTLLYVLTLIHPQLPGNIRDKYGKQIGKRIMDYKAEIFLEAMKFVSMSGSREHIENIHKHPAGLEDYEVSFSIF